MSVGYICMFTFPNSLVSRTPYTFFRSNPINC